MAAAGLAAGAAQPTFRARTELVRLDVLVTDDGVPVAGLTAGDFEVRDNGVRQRLAAAAAVESVQLVVVLDVSGSMTGERIALARAATRELLAQLEPADSAALVAFGDQVGLLAGRGTTAARAAGALELVEPAGGTALVDGLYAGILEAGAEPGPRLVLAMTDGRNNSSWLKTADVVDVARRWEAVIYPVAVGADRQWVRGVAPDLRTSDSLALLRVIAEDTGGRAIEASWNAGLGAVFRRILAEYRQRYILSFTPEGVSTGDGWHRLEVKVKRRGTRIRARTSYWAGP
jgi:VWFA-related protein